MSVELYSPSSDAWSDAEISDDRTLLCVCAFVGIIFVIGEISCLQTTNSCLKFNPKSFKRERSVEIKETKIITAYVVFEGIIVVCDGWGYDDTLISVESYYATSKKQMMMPNVIYKIRDIIAVRSKLFVTNISW